MNLPTTSEKWELLILYQACGHKCPRRAYWCKEKEKGPKMKSKSIINILRVRLVRENQGLFGQNSSHKYEV